MCWTETSRPCCPAFVVAGGEISTTESAELWEDAMGNGWGDVRTGCGREWA